MPGVSRRQYLQGTLATLGATAPTGAALAARPGQQGDARIRFALMLSPGQTTSFRLAKQMGVNHAIAGVTGVLRRTHRSKYVEALTAVKQEFAGAGLTISAVESHPVPAEKIKLGIEGRDEEIENYIAAIDALGKVGVPVVCYNFMAGLGWYRTKTDVLERGGALTSEFDNAAAKAQGQTEWGEIPEEMMWSNIEYFLKAVIPAAEKANVMMALHPDDPPLSPLRGIGRIVTSAKNYERIMKMVPSPVNGVTFCQANFVAMGEDIYKLSADWGRRKKIFFVHFRDIEGRGERFRETFHDNGPTNMARMLKIYHEIGMSVPMRPDHAPTMEGEKNDRPGYAMLGKVFAIGYMKGLMEGMGLPYA